MLATHRDVDGLAGARGADEQAGLAVRHELLHQERVADRVHRRNDDLVKRHLLQAIRDAARPCSNSTPLHTRGKAAKKNMKIGDEARPC